MFKWNFNKPEAEGAFLATMTIQPKGLMNEPMEVVLSASTKEDLLQKIKSSCDKFVHCIDGEIHHNGVKESFTLFNK